MIALWGAGQTINVMTLGGLALAVGILVDEATVAIENIHTHLARGVPVARGRAGRERRSGRAATARHALGRGGVRPVVLHDRRVALAVRAAVARGRLLDDRVVLPLELARAGAVGLAPRAHVARRGRPRAPRRTGSIGCGIASGGLLQRLAPARWLLVTVYAAVTIAVVVVVGLDPRTRDLPGRRREPVPAAVPRAGRDQVRIDRAAGHRCARRDQAGGRCRTTSTITLGYVGVQPSSYPINTIFLWTGGSHEGVLQVALKPEAGIRLTDFEETLRQRFSERFPTAQFSFEPGDIVNRIMNFGTSTPVEVAITGPDFAASRTFAAKVRDELARIPALRDLQYGQALDYPGDSGRCESPDGRPAGRDRRSDWAFVCGGDLVQPLRRAELLG